MSTSVPSSLPSNFERVMTASVASTNAPNGTANPRVAQNEAPTTRIEAYLNLNGNNNVLHCMSQVCKSRKITWSEAGKDRNFFGQLLNYVKHNLPIWLSGDQTATANANLERCICEIENHTLKLTDKDAKNAKEILKNLQTINDKFRWKITFALRELTAVSNKDINIDRLLKDLHNDTDKETNSDYRNLKEGLNREGHGTLAPKIKQQKMNELDTVCDQWFAYQNSPLRRLTNALQKLVGDK